MKTMCMFPKVGMQMLVVVFFLAILGGCITLDCKDCCGGPGGNCPNADASLEPSLASPGHTCVAGSLKCQDHRKCNPPQKTCQDVYAAIDATTGTCGCSCK